MYKISDMCFGDKERINFQEFSKINEEIASDMLLSVLNLFREKLPCSENYWRLKRTFELEKPTIQTSFPEESKGGDAFQGSSPNGSTILADGTEV